jgi:hypothetical protein
MKDTPCHWELISRNQPSAEVLAMYYCRYEHAPTIEGWVRTIVVGFKSFVDQFSSVRPGCSELLSNRCNQDPEIAETEYHSYYTPSSKTDVVLRG